VRLVWGGNVGCSVESGVCVFRVQIFVHCFLRMQGISEAGYAEAGMNGSRSSGASLT
jgi:hypothetical protein